MEVLSEHSRLYIKMLLIFVVRIDGMSLISMVMTEFFSGAIALDTVMLNFVA